MTRLLTIMFILALVQVSFAVNFSGSVIDAENKSPIPFAHINFIDLNTGVICDENGQFEYSGNLPQNILTQVSAVGYDTKLFKIPAGTETLTIELEPSHMELEEFIVSSKSELQNVTSTNVERRSVKDLQTVPTNDIIQAIANIPSVYNQNTGNGINKPVIRGLSGIRVVTFLNGLRIENQQWGGDHGIGISDNGIAHVEIIKGPASLLYGVDALGGVLFLREESYANQNSVEGYVSSQFESNSLKSNNSIGVKLSGTKLSFNLFANNTSASDYQLPDGRYLKTSRFYQNDIKTSLGYHHKNWMFNLRYTFVNGRIGIPGHTHDSIVNVESFLSDIQKRDKTIPAQVISNHFVLAENNFYLRNSILKIKTGFTSNHLQEYEEKITIPGLDMTLNNFFNHVLWDWNIAKDQHLYLGGQTMHQQSINDPSAEGELIPDATTHDYGGYVLYKGGFKAINYQAGVRYDQRSILTNKEDSTPWNPAFSGFNYSAGVNTEIKKFTIRVNASSGFRPPHSSETIVNGVHHGTFRYELGDENLKSENALQFDVGTEYAGEHLHFAINPYYMQVDNFIYVQPVDSVISGFNVYQYTQDSQATIMGGDVSFHYHPHFAHRLHIEHNFSLLQGTRSDGDYLPLMPPARTNTMLRYQLDTEGIFAINYVAFQHLYYFAQNQVDQLETTSGAYHLLYLAASFTLNIKYPIDIKLGVNNLLNEAFIPHLSRLKDYGIQAPGRNFTIGIKINLNNNQK